MQGLQELQKLLMDPRNAHGVERPRTLPLPRRSRKLISDVDHPTAHEASLGVPDPEAALDQQAALAAKLGGEAGSSGGRKGLHGGFEASHALGSAKQDLPSQRTSRRGSAAKQEVPRRLREARARRAAGKGGRTVPAAEAFAVPADAAEVEGVQEEVDGGGAPAWARVDAGNLEEDEEAEHGTGPQWQLEIDDREVPASHFRPREEAASAQHAAGAAQQADVAAGAQDMEHMRRQHEATVQEWLHGRSALDAQRDAAGAAGLGP